MRQLILTLALSSTSVLAAINLRAASFHHLAGLDKRQTITTCFGTYPVGVPNPCEYVCGAGARTCVELPNCFNPAQGEKCCSDGTACPAGSYCTDIGCCQDGISLEECGATQTIATLEGIGYTSTAAPPSSTDAPSSYADSTTTSDVVTAPVEPTTYSSPSSTTTSDTSSSVPVAPVLPTPPINGTNGILPSYTPVQQTGNAAIRQEVMGWTLSGLSFLGLGFFL